MNNTNLLEEKKTVTIMINLYYKNNNIDIITQDELYKYAMDRLNNCPFQDSKPTCERCTIHCYQEKYQLQMKKVMRYSGPRMIIHHPIRAIKHLLKNKAK